MQGLNFIAIDLNTATGKHASVCEAGICLVRAGEIRETRSWLVRPQGNYYSYWNMQTHGIRPEDTINSLEFPEIWTQIAEYLKECPVLVAHNAVFDMSCIRHSLGLYNIEKPEVTYYCSLQAARRIYNFGCHTLDYLCDQLDIPYGQHHRAGEDAEMCARLFLREIKDAGCKELRDMKCDGRKFL